MARLARGASIPSVLVALALAAAPVSGCKSAEDDAEDEDEAGEESPPVPPPGTLTIDTAEGGTLTDDSALTLVDSLAALTATTGGANHAQAMVVAVAVNVNLALQVSIPVALLRKAQEVDPVKSGAKTWIWSYDVAVGAKTWTGNLTGVRTGEGTATWSMAVTSSTKDDNDCCTDFVFFDGATSSDTEGAWQIYDPAEPAEKTKLFAVQYDYTSDDSKTLTYTVNGTRDADERFGNGSTVKYAVTGGEVTLTVDDSSEDGERIITWDRATKVGRHVDPQGNAVCWGPAPEFADADCD